MDAELESSKKTLFIRWPCSLHQKILLMYVLLQQKLALSELLLNFFCDFSSCSYEKIKPLQIKGRDRAIPHILYVLFPLEVTGASWDGSGASTGLIPVL